MSVIASCLYRQGARVADVPIAEAKIPEAEDEFIWIGLSEPTPEELHALDAPFDLHPLAMPSPRIRCRRSMSMAISSLSLPARRF